MSKDEAASAPAIVSGTTEQRLDAIVRRQGGKPKSIQSGFRLPPVGKRTCKDQLPLFADPEGSSS